MSTYNIFIKKLKEALGKDSSISIAYVGKWTFILYLSVFLQGSARSDLIYYVSWVPITSWIL